MPGTQPGAPLPHAEVEDADGRRFPLMQLVRAGEFLLIAGEEGDAWCAAADAIAAADNIPVRAVRIGHLEGDYRDPRCTWLPDRFVGWRSVDASAHAAAALRAALARILCRSAA